MPEYHVDTGFKGSRWQDGGELELGQAVVRAHRRSGDPMGNNELAHGLLHVAAEKQLLHPDLPQAARALERLLADGLSRHDAIHAIGRQTLYTMWDIQHGGVEGDANEVLAATLERIARMGLVAEFQFRAPLFGPPDEDGSLDAGEEPRAGAWEGDAVGSWVDQLAGHFRASPEGRDVAAGWVEGFLSGQLGWGLHPAGVMEVEDALERVMAAPMDMPCEPDDAEAIVAELEAFHRFAARVFDWPVGAEAAAALRGDLVVRRLRAAIAETPKTDELEAMLRARGVDPEDADQLEAFVAAHEPAFREPFGAERDREPAAVLPFRREEPRVGRNAPCPCGSGRKYKKCCGR